MASKPGFQRVDVQHAHPFWARPFPDISVVHNGHITNYHKLRRRLENQGHRFATGNDSEVIAVYIADKLARGENLVVAQGQTTLEAAALERRAIVARPGLDGRAAGIVLTPARYDLVARDPFALKPLLFAESHDVVLIASEEISIRAVDGDAALVPRELAAGEVRWWLR